MGYENEELSGCKSVTQVVYVQNLERVLPGEKTVETSQLKIEKTFKIIGIVGGVHRSQNQDVKTVTFFT